jgi:hypothetical protein
MVKMTDTPEAFGRFTIKAEEGQYYIDGGPERKDPWPPPQDGLTTGEDN